MPPCRRVRTAIFAAVLALSGVSLAISARALPDMATAAGNVDSSMPFKAAQVFLRNVDKRMTYMVYTSAGRYRAVALFPGNYEVTARAAGLQSSTLNVALKPGEAAVIPRLSLAAAPDTLERVSYDELYPPGPERAIAERTCIRCHGVDFLPPKRWNEEQWTAAVDYMRGRPYKKGLVATDSFTLAAGKITDAMMGDQDRDRLIAWLVKHFGPNSKLRSLRFDNLLPVDEAKLSKALYIEYHLAPDPPGHGINDPQYSKEHLAARLHQPGQMMFVESKGPEDARFDPDGNVWLIVRGYPNRLVRLDPRTGAMKEYMLSDPLSGAHDITVDRDGMVWVPEHHGIDARQPKHLTMFNPKTEKWESRYRLDPDGVIRSPEKYGFGVAFDSKQNMYVGWLQGSALTMWDRQTKKSVVFPLPTPNTNVYGVEVDKTDNVWAAEYQSGKVAKFDPRTGKWTEYTPPTQPAQIRRLNVDARNNVWFGIWASGRRKGRLVKLEQPSGTMTEYEMPYDNAQPYHVAAYGDDIWVADAGQGGALVRFSTQDRSFSAYPSPQRGDKARIQITRDGAIWYAPRGRGEPSGGVLYPDMHAITSLAAYPPARQP